MSEEYSLMFQRIKNNVMMRKGLLLLALSLLTCFPAWSLEIVTFDYEGISYEVLSEEDKTACVCRQIETDLLVGDVVIPSHVKFKGAEYTVSEISGWAFSSCDKMTSIAIPATIQRIGYSAFHDCFALKAVHLEDLAAWCAVTQGGGEDCNPVSVSKRIFVNGKEVKDLVIPEGVNDISPSAFNNVTYLTSLTIPSTVKKIGADAFAGCCSLTSVSFAEGLQVIGGGAFMGCNKLTEVTLPEGVERMEWSVFAECYKLSTIQLPQSLRHIGSNAFAECKNLKSIDIPDAVTELGGYAFYECDSLTTVRLSDNIQEIDDWTFTRSYKLKNVNIPKNLKRIGEYAFLVCYELETLDIPRTLTDIAQSAFVGCHGFRSITVEEGNPKYLCDDGVLFNQDKTTLMLFPALCDKTHYDIPVTVTTIYSGAFSGSKLKSITLPQTWTRIGDGALAGCGQLESIDIPSTVTAIGPSAFSGCSSLKEIDIPSGVQSVGTGAFMECTSLVRIQLPEGVKRIEGWTFDGCTSLSDVVIPAVVKYIGTAAFRNCNNLSAFQIPQDVTTIDEEAFIGCKLPTELVIPDKVTKIGWDAFGGCSGLVKLTLGRSVKSLNGGTFYNCDNIRQIWSFIEKPFDVIDYVYGHEEVVLFGSCFSKDVTSNATLYVPLGTIDMYRSKRGWKDFVDIREFDVAGIGNDPNVNENSLKRKGEMYDLQGRRVNRVAPRRGVVVKNGKKIIDN